MIHSRLLPFTSFTDSSYNNILAFHLVNYPSLIIRKFIMALSFILPFPKSLAPNRSRSEMIPTGALR